MAANPPNAYTCPPPPYPSYPTRSISYPAQSPAGPGPGMTQSPVYPPFGQNGHNPHTSHFVGNQTRRQEPPNTLHTSLMSPTSSQGTPSPSSMPRGLTRDDQIERLTTTFRRKNKKIGVFYNQPQKGKADSIVRRLNDLLSGGVCIVQGFEILPQTSDWLQRALSGGVDYFIFVGLPPPVAVASANIPRPQYEEHITPKAYFDVQKYVQRVAEVVVIPTEARPSRSTHYLSKFLHLESENMDKVAEDCLALFAAPRPKPFTADSAYFSEVPKLIAIPKKPGKSLGLSIMTREMSPDSEFPRIVLIKSFSSDCVDDVKNKLGKYTHIQSYNGVYLDGMDIKAVTTIFQSMSSPTAYLTVRYIHPIQNATPPHRRGQSTPICKPTAPRLDPRREELPIPLYILGDIYSHNKRLFDLLSNEAHSPVSSSSSSSLATPLSESQMSFTADPSCLDGFQEEGSDSVHPLDSVAKGMHERANSKRLHSRPLSQSDDSFDRALLLPQLYENVPPLTFDRTPSYPGNGMAQPTRLARQSSHAPPSGNKRYILQLPHKNLDRRFTHIFFRRSGIYLITVGLGEMMGDPLIQFENLCYWLRQVQTYVGPENVKRVLIVGMHETHPGDGPRLEKIQSFIVKLDQAIREADFKQQIMEVSRKMSIISFNLSSAVESVRLLCQCVNSCMDVMIERIWCYENPSVFKTMFEPFTQLSNVAAKISGIKAVIATTKDIEECYNYSDPDFKETLANYSPACISLEGDYHLIRPAFLNELLRSLEMNSHNYMIHATNITALKKLPVLNAPFPKAQMETLMAQKREFRQITPDQQVAVLDWAENLELIYSLGKHKDHKLYFVPFLASEVLGDQANYDWDPDEAAHFLADDFTVLYAEMHIPSSYQFFYGLLAELLKDVVTEHDAQKQRCCINLGCKEAILPMHYIDERLHSRVFRVYLQYHPLQNIIEFRAKIVKQQLAFLRTVENKLKGALGNSKSYGGSRENFYEALSFAFPAPTFSQKLSESALWVLGEPVTYSGGCDEEDYDEPEDVRERDLLKMKPMTRDMQREWASSAPEMKEIPSELFLKWSKNLSGNGDKWALVGAKLGLLSVEDIQFHTHNPHKGGNGELVLSMWHDSDCSYKDLVATLRDQEVRLDTLATQIESHFAVDK